MRIRIPCLGSSFSARSQMIDITLSRPVMWSDHMKVSTDFSRPASSHSRW